MVLLLNKREAQIKYKSILMQKKISGSIAAMKQAKVVRITLLILIEIFIV
jgi:hypothetical protein